MMAFFLSIASTQSKNLFPLRLQQARGRSQLIVGNPPGYSVLELELFPHFATVFLSFSLSNLYLQ